MSCVLIHLNQRDAPSLLTRTSDPSSSSMSPSARNPSLACRTPKCQVADYTVVYMIEAVASVEGWGRDHYSLLVPLLECPHQVVGQHCWPHCCWAHWRQVLKRHPPGLRIALSLERMDSEVGPNICWRMQHRQNISPHFFFWLRSAVSLVCPSTVHLMLSWFDIIPVAGVLRQTQQCTSFCEYSSVDETGLSTLSEMLMRGIYTRCSSWTADCNCQGCLWQTGISSSLVSPEVQLQLKCQTVGLPKKIKSRVIKQLNKTWATYKKHYSGT